MMPDVTDRLLLPLLAAGQAQKEVTHNEALVLIDALVQPVVQSIAPASVPASPAAGQCWIVGTGATGAWAGRDGALACWTGGGWRFAAAFEGMRVWNLATGTEARRGASSWSTGIVSASEVHISANRVVSARQSAITGPSGGATIDTEGRIAINAILAAMCNHGLIAL